MFLRELVFHNYFGGSNTSRKQHENNNNQTHSSTFQSWLSILYISAHVHPNLEKISKKGKKSRPGPPGAAGRQ